MTRRRWSPRVLRLPRRTVRVRLTMLYAAVSFISGLALLAIPFAAVGSGSTSSVASSNGAAIGRVAAVSQHGRDVHQILVASAIALGLLIVVSLALGWWLAGRLLQPLRTITSTARHISVSNLHQRLDLNGPDDEFTELGRTLDDLFGRLEGSFEAQRHFVANASHELRTPLAAERTLLQVALADPDADAAALRATCEEVLTIGERQGRLVEALLTLATSEQGLDRHEPFDAAEVAQAVVLLANPEATAHRIRIDVDLRPAPVDGDAPLVESLVANLVDNAIRHNHPGGRVTVTTALVDGGTVVTVANTGPVIDPDEVGTMFEPFRRLGRARLANAQGHGLGLAIVSAIAAAHRADLEARPRPGGGVEVTVSFPTRAGPHGDRV
jgi:signal transduction histidine kinase